MKVNVRVAQNFKKEAKHLLKKYPSLKFELANLEQNLIAHPTMGTALGNNVYKIRLKISSKGKGKSGGARVISYLETEIIGDIEETENEITVNLISIYDKSETQNISQKELSELIKVFKNLES